MIRWSNRTANMQTTGDWKLSQEGQCQHPCKSVRYNPLKKVKNTVMMLVHTESHTSHQKHVGKAGPQTPPKVMSVHPSSTPLERARPWAKVQKGHQRGHQKVQEKVKLDHVGRVVHSVTPGPAAPNKGAGKSGQWNWYTPNCTNCGQWGHTAASCPWPKGAGKAK